MILRKLLFLFCLISAVVASLNYIGFGEGEVDPIRMRLIMVLWAAYAMITGALLQESFRHKEQTNVTVSEVSILLKNPRFDRDDKDDQPGFQLTVD